MTAARNRLFLIATSLMMIGPWDGARANIVLSQVILDVKSGDAAAQDIEVWNNSADRNYITADPVEVVNPGQPDERRVANPDPSVSGILVTPQRMILEAGQRRLIRVALVLPSGDRDRIYRVAIQPVAGDIAASATALKVMVGYDVLVIHRPEKTVSDVTAERAGNAIIFTNAGNTNVEMFEGRQCDAAGANCKALPANRLYAGAKWQVPVDPQRQVEYHIVIDGKSVVKTF